MKDVDMEAARYSRMHRLLLEGQLVAQLSGQRGQPGIASQPGIPTQPDLGAVPGQMAARPRQQSGFLNFLRGRRGG